MLGSGGSVFNSDTAGLEILIVTDEFEDFILMLLSVFRARKKSRVKVVRKQMKSRFQILGVSVMKDPVSNTQLITTIHTRSLGGLVITGWELWE